MNSEEALKEVDRLIAGGKVMRVSSAERTTKGIVFRTLSHAHFAVMLNDGIANSDTQQTRLVFERAPGAQAPQWNAIAADASFTVSEQQLGSTLLKLRGANLEPGKQFSVFAAKTEDLSRLVAWFADATQRPGAPRALVRAEIEAAMDEYDALGLKGVMRSRFRFAALEHFRVRPSRKRRFAHYPATVIAALAQGERAPRQGWETADAAAALLHNSGYILVDAAGLPVPVPSDRYPHLLKGADRIRACALANYIGPARDRGDASVTIVAGALHQEIGLSEAWANVCQALRGRKFLDQAGVAPPTESGPLASTTTTFTYHLAENAIPMPTIAPLPTNLILYGPPGTGKTHETAAAAVRLCLGQAALPLLDPDRRGDLMAAYRRLANEGRIEFITFHQSYAYEDFVEGLRPTTDPDETMADAEDSPAGLAEDAAAQPASGGFRLRSRDGIFKRICTRARLDHGDVALPHQLDRHRRIFKMALGRRGIEEDRISAGLAGNLIHLGWGGDIDWSDERYDNFEAIRREWRSRKDPQATGKDGNIEMMWSFRSEMQVGDYVALSDGLDTIRALGQVTGEYYYDASAPYHPHRRAVEWIWQSEKGAKRARFYDIAFRRHSVYRLRQSVIDWDGLEHIIAGGDTERAAAAPRPYVLVIDEINRANISKVFGELITLLEPDKRLGQVNELRVTLPYSDEPAFGVPSNLHIIGTMNTADRSIALLDTALRRRFTFRELMPEPSLLPSVDGIDLATLLATINARIEYLFDREHQIGHAYFIGCESRQDVEDVMRYKVIPLLAEYFYEDWSKVAAVLGDADEGDTDREGGFLTRTRLAAPKGMGGEADATPRFRWSVRERFDFAKLVRG